MLGWQTSKEKFKSNVKVRLKKMSKNITNVSKHFNKKWMMNLKFLIKNCLMLKKTL